jgi:phage terminase Nu1 subunit (DNA packaging protein)
MSAKDFRSIKISQREAAEFFNVDSATVRKTAQMHNMKAPYNLMAITRAYIDRLRDVATSKDKMSSERVDLVQEQARLAKAKADDQEMKNAVNEGELVSSAEVELAWSEIVAAIRAGVLAMGSRLAPELTGLKTERQMKARIDKEAHTLLTDLSDESPH